MDDLGCVRPLMILGERVVAPAAHRGLNAYLGRRLSGERLSGLRSRVTRIDHAGWLG